MLLWLGIFKHLGTEQNKTKFSKYCHNFIAEKQKQNMSLEIIINNNKYDG